MPDLARLLELLEREGALHLDHDHPVNERPHPWPTVDEDEQPVEVDFARLFPTRRPARDGEDFELYGDEWEPTEDDLRHVLFDDDAADYQAEDADAPPPQWDIWAWYQPIHYFGPDFGIYIKETALLECARRIRTGYTGSISHGRARFLLAKAFVRAAFATLYLHEQYHHKTESFALRLHIVQQQSIHPAYFWNVYTATAGTDAQIEEGLANADSWFRMKHPPYRAWISPSVLSATLRYLERSFTVAPRGYRNAVRLLTPDAFEAEQQRLFAQVQEGASKPARRSPTDFGLATHMNRGLFPITQRIYTIVPRGTTSVLPVHPAIAPLKTSRLERHIVRSGWTLVRGGGKGSHKKYRDGVGRMIVLPDAKDVSPAVLRTTAATLGLRPRELEAVVR